MEKSELTTRILDQLKVLPFRDRIEILGNVFIRLGLLAIELRDPVAVPDKINPEQLFTLAAKYKKQHGETIEGAVLAQGLTILMWLRTEM